MLKQAILNEREACAKIADKYVGNKSYIVAECIGRQIRARPDPSIKVVRPETVEKNPDAAKDALVLGVGISKDGQSIIGHWPGAGAKDPLNGGKYSTSEPCGLGRIK